VVVGRVFIASIVGAIVVFTWGFIAWAVLDLYKPAIEGLPNADVVIPVLKANVPQTGAYFFPPEPIDRSDTAAMEAYGARHRAGPIGMLMYCANGAEPMHWTVMARGFCIYFVASMLLSCVIMAAQLRSFALRFAFVIIAAAFAAMTCHVSNWNWLMFPDRFATAMTIDVMIGWSIAGVFIAAIVRPKRPVMA
jgi:hypothetical protein